MPLNSSPVGALPHKSWLAVVLCLGLFLRVLWILHPVGSVDSDEAVFGLMALSILDGRDYPLYCWGAHYAGAVVSYLAAVAFLMLGPSGTLLKLSTLPFVVGYLGATYGLARQLFDRPGSLWALLLAAVPPALPVDISVKAWGGYPETLCLGGLILLLAFSLSSDRPATWYSRDLWLLGLLAGLALYISLLVLPYVFVAAMFLVTRRWKCIRGKGIAVLLAAGIVGIAPLLVHNILYPFATVLRLGSRVFGVSRAEVLADTVGPNAVLAWLTNYASRLPGLASTLLENLGPLLGLPSQYGWLPAILIITAVGVALWRTSSETDSSCRLNSCGSWLALFILTYLVFAWLAGLDRPRHLIPLYFVLPLGIVALLRLPRVGSPWLARGGLGLTVLAAFGSLGSGLLGTLEPEAHMLSRFLNSHNFLAVYTDYHTAYPIMFLTQERILASPVGWTDGPLSDRTPHITRRLDEHPRPTYVFRSERPEAIWFADGLRRRGIHFHEKEFAGYRIFYNLSSPIHSSSLPVAQAW
jgi:hypothetical protein